MKRAQKSIILSAILLITLLVVVVCYFYKHNSRDYDYTIWVVHSHEHSYEQYVEYNQLLEKNFARQGIRAQFRYNYLNCNRFIEVAEDSICKHWIDSVDAAGKWPDLIITTEDQATYAMLSTNREQLRRGPIMFGGVRFPNYKLLAKYDNVTGIRDTIELEPCLRVLRELIGNRHAFTSLDRLFFDRKILSLLEAQMKDLPILNNLHWDYRLFQLQRVSPDSTTITSIAMRQIGDNTNRDVSPEDRANRGNENFFMMLGPQGMCNNLLLKFDATSHSIATMSLRPQLSGINNLFGTQNSAIVGGYFSSIDTWAKEQAVMGAQLLRGTKPADLPIELSKKDYYADWEAAKKFNYTLDRIPEYFNIINLPFRDKHPVLFWSLIVAGSLIIILSISISVFSAHKATQKTLAAYKALRENKMAYDFTSSFTQSFVWRTHDESVTIDDSFWAFINQPVQSLTTCEFMERWVHPDFHEVYRTEIWESKSTEYHAVELLCDFSGNGNYNWWEVRTKGEYDAMGNYATFGLLINIDDMKEREEELILARKRMEEADIKESFLANMSHEIRTPLNAIVGFSNLLASPDDLVSQEEKEEYFELIKQNNDLLLKLVNDILDISRIESGYMEFNFETVNISSFVDGVEHSYSVQAPGHLKFIYKPGKSDIKLFIDTSRAHQVLMNFLTNAGKFTPAGYIALGWEYHHDIDEVEIYVEDTGIGLSENDCVLIFNRFYKKNEFVQGTGLGLSICSVIAERLRGRLTVKSKINKGSRFSLWLKPVHNGE